MSLELSNITVLRQRRTILDDVSLTVEPGQVVALVGPNGAGKSTLLGVCAAAIHPDKGSVQWEGSDLAALSAPELALVRSHLPQDPMGDVGFTAREVVAMGRYALQRAGATDHAKDIRVVAEAMRAFDVDGFADRPIRTLSGGERARVAIARTLVQHAPVILLDEPTAALDLAHQERGPRAGSRRNPLGHGRSRRPPRPQPGGHACPAHHRRVGRDHRRGRLPGGRSPRRSAVRGLPPSPIRHRPPIPRRALGRDSGLRRQIGFAALAFQMPDSPSPAVSRRAEF